MGFFDSVSPDAAFSAGASFVGDVFQSDQSRRAAHSAQDFSELMSNTQYQRAMADMKAAGLNPMLAAKLGGNSSPTGVVQQIPQTGQDAINQYNAREQLNANVAAATAQARAANTQADKNVADANYTSAQEANTRQNMAYQVAGWELNLQKLREEIENLHSGSGRNVAEAGLAGARTTLTKQDIDAFDDCLASQLALQSSQTLQNFAAADMNRSSARDIDLGAWQKDQYNQFLFNRPGVRDAANYSKAFGFSGSDILSAVPKFMSLMR